jgi:hypothetical protein
MLPPVE